MSLSWKLLHTRIKNIFGVLIQQKAKPQLKKKKKKASTDLCALTWKDAYEIVLKSKSNCRTVYVI